MVEPSGATAPTSGAIVSCVALVEDQLSVTASPLLIEVGFAWSVTVGRAAGGSDVGAVPVMTGFLLQPTVRAAAAKATRRQAR